MMGSNLYMDFFFFNDDWVTSKLWLPSGQSVRFQQVLETSIVLLSYNLIFMFIYGLFIVLGNMARTGH